jgi:hypothetical protein
LSYLLGYYVDCYHRTKYGLIYQFTLARALHIFVIVLWIGGVAFVTTVLIPSLKQIPDIHDRLVLFEKLEGKFAIQVRIIPSALNMCSCNAQEKKVLPRHELQEVVILISKFITQVALVYPARLITN